MYKRQIYGDGSVLFVFIAGYLFQHLSNRFDIKKYYLSKLQNVVIPYLIISIPAILFYITVEQKNTVWPSFYENPAWLQMIYFYITGLHLSPMWFIPMIIMFYLLAPVLVKADKTRYFYCLLPFFLLVSFSVERGLTHHNFMHFFSIYILGMFCSKYKEIANKLLTNNKTISLLTAIFISLSVAAFNIKITLFTFAQKIVFSLLSLGIFIRMGKKADLNISKVLADTSFGVFFIHGYVLFIAKFLSRHLNQLLHHSHLLIRGNLILHLITTILVLTSSVWLVLLIQHFAGSKSRLLVGS